MGKLAKWINIILFLVMVIVLVFYVMNRVGVRIPLPNINKQYCGDQICQLKENQDNCCIDCGCSNNQVCINNKCQTSLITSTTPLDTTQTTIGSTPSGKGTEPASETPSEITETTTQTTSTIGCSYDNCEACENKTACYNAGCVWCLSDRCLRICKGQTL